MDPEPAVGRTQFGSADTSVEYIELMAKSQDPDLHLDTASETESNGLEKGSKEHSGPRLTGRVANFKNLRAYGVLRMHRFYIVN